MYRFILEHSSFSQTVINYGNACAIYNVKLIILMVMEICMNDKIDLTIQRNLLHPQLCKPQTPYRTSYVTLMSALSCTFALTASSSI
jgi:hypothetical protein